MIQQTPLTDEDYQTLATFRHALRRFYHFSENAAEAKGLTPQQHQALLAIRSAMDEGMTIGRLAEQLMLRPHSATGLVDRLATAGLVERLPNPADKRQVLLRLTPDASAVLEGLSIAHRDEIRRMRPMLLNLLDQLA